MVVTIVAFFLPQCSLSQMIETLVSSNEMEEVSAANSTRIKNAVPMKPENGMLSNTFGRVMNIRDGPLLRASSLPPENTNTEVGLIG